VSWEPRARLKRGAFGVRAAVGALADLRHGGGFLATFEAMWRDFLAAARDERAVECSLADGRETTRILLAALDSVARGEAVRVDATPRVPPPASPVGRAASG
jgi:predicted dehydrogenase